MRACSVSHERAEEEKRVGKEAEERTDHPRESRFSNSDRLVQVMTVQAQPRLEPQRVPRRQPGQLDLLLVEQNVGEIFGLRVRDRDFKAVFARVATAGDVNRGGGREGMNREVHGLAKCEEFLDGNVLGQQSLQGDMRLRTCKQGSPG